MKPLRRGPVNKHRSARKFRKHVSRTHGRNIMPVPMRGGWRL